MAIFILEKDKHKRKKRQTKRDIIAYIGQYGPKRKTVIKVKKLRIDMFLLSQISILLILLHI